MHRHNQHAADSVAGGGLDDPVAATMCVKAPTACKPQEIPGRRHTDVEAGKVADCVAQLNPEGHSKHRAGVGQLQFMVNEHPDIAYAVEN